MGIYKMENLTKNVNRGAFGIFVVSLLMFIYLLVIDSRETQDKRSGVESIWVAIFFIMLVGCIYITGYYVLKKTKKPKSMISSPPIRKKLLTEEFGNSMLQFVGKNHY